MSADRETLLALPDRRRMAPLKAAAVDDAFNDWPIAYQTGNSGEDGKDWAIVTDRVNASAFYYLTFPADAKEDAEAIVAILMAYRSGRLAEAEPLLALLAEAREALASLANAKALSGVRETVAGWNGEELPKPHSSRHPDRLGAHITTNCGAVYALDEGMTSARETLARIDAALAASQEAKG